MEGKFSSSVLEKPLRSSLSPPATLSPATHSHPAVVWLHPESLETTNVKNENNNILTIFFHLNHQSPLQDKISNFNHSDTAFKSSSPRKK